MHGATPEIAAHCVWPQVITESRPLDTADKEEAAGLSVSDLSQTELAALAAGKADLSSLLDALTSAAVATRALLSSRARRRPRTAAARRHAPHRCSAGRGELGARGESGSRRRGLCRG